MNASGIGGMRETKSQNKKRKEKRDVGGAGRAYAAIIRGHSFVDQESISSDRQSGAKSDRGLLLIEKGKFTGGKTQVSFPKKGAAPDKETHNRTT